MNAASAIIGAIIVLLAVFAAWRSLTKGAPCECGGNRKLFGAKSGCGCGCPHCHKEAARREPKEKR